MDIPIVAVAYNRPASIVRLLNSLNSANYPCIVKLYISIDGGGAEEVKCLAHDFEWKHGEKQVIIHDSNMGLRNHILSCGDLSLQHDGIIILEDDLYVSPAFYNYTTNALTYYNNEKRVSGISLYSHSYNETTQMPFVPIEDETDVFFLQLASSWGQCWSRIQWKKFRSWYKKKSSQKLCLEDGIPASVIKWPDSSWKKFFIKYMVEKNLYFVYPRVSLSTNFGDDGMHHLGDNHFQVPLLYKNKTFEFCKFSKSFARYDSYCEIIPECLQRLTNRFDKYDFSVDLYASKPLKHIKNQYLLTSRGTINPIFSYSRKMIPHEANVIAEIPGDKIQFTKLTDVKSNIQGYTNERVVYFHRLPRWHLKDNKKEDNKPSTLSQKEQTLLMIYSKRLGKIALAPLLFVHHLYVMIKIRIIKHEE